MPDKARSFLSLLLVRLGLKKAGEEARKTVTFGDPEAARGGLFWSICAVAAVFISWSIYGWYVDGLSEKESRKLVIFMPTLSLVWEQFVVSATDGYRNSTLLEHIGVSVYRLLTGFILGCIVGIPAGFAMGLSRFWNGLLNPVVEFMRPVPPLALIPLSIIYLGIDDKPKIALLFLAALFVMILSARAGVQGIRMSKIHAAYTLGASKQQVLFRVILPNALPEIFTGMRVAMGICWGTLVAAELVGADSGIGYMITVAGKFLDTALVFIGIIIIGVIGFSIDAGMKRLESKLVPWKGKG